MALLCLFVDFLYEVAKDCERVCEAVFVNVFCNVESCVIIARKIEVHRRHAHALEAPSVYAAASVAPFIN